MASNTTESNTQSARQITEKSASGKKNWFGRIAIVVLLLLVAGIGVGAYAFFARYDLDETMKVHLEEFITFDYPEDPAARSPHYSQYNGRRLKLIQLDDTHFDFVFEPLADHVAQVVFKNVDVSLMTPGLPEYPDSDIGIQRIALTDREWNRQQVQFYVGDDNVEVTGGDGFETENLAVASLAKNCLNAGLWEVILSTKNDAGKQMYYQGWFTFPMGQYKRVWEQNTKLSYWDDMNWYRMEHWYDPAGNVIPMKKLRTVVSEREIPATFDPAEPIRFGGEQIRKRRTSNAPNVVTWGDVAEKRDNIRFASFIPPGYYESEKPWKNEYERIAKLEKTTLRKVTSKLNGERFDELELLFNSANGRKKCRFFVGGIDLAALPQLSDDEYPAGLYMPMGIGVPPFYQDYADLKAAPPTESPYYSFMLDENDAWIDHHTTAVDGPVMHRDQGDPNLVHLYFLSYERHLLVAHFELKIEDDDPPAE